MRITVPTAAVFAAVLAVTRASAKEMERRDGEATTSVTVDLAATRRVIEGFGSSSRAWSDPHVADANVFVPAAAQAKMLAALYCRLGLTRVRNVLGQGYRRLPGAAPSSGASWPTPISLS